jgi:KaiC/GvpD/RAD55 family RecA-like ATPase
MSITLKKNKGIDLKPPEFICDNDLGDHLNNHDMLNHLNKFTFNGFIGKPGSGKTSLMISMLTSKKEKRIFRKCFNNILLVMPESSRNSLKKNVFEKHPEEKMYEELNYENITDIYNKLNEYSKENETTMLILDDVGATLKNLSIQTTLRKIIYNRRHLKVSIFILLQSYMSLPKEIRKLFNNIFMFKPSKVEFENLFNELFEQKKDLAIDIMNFVYTDPHDYLMLNTDTQKMYKDFDEILFSEKSPKS